MIKAPAATSQQSWSESVDVRDCKMQRAAAKDPAEEHKSVALIESSSVPVTQPEIESVPGRNGICEDCRHLHCGICEEHSATKQYSDFWICHRCGELNRRV